MKSSPDALLILRLRVQNANAISSPLTWGFPAPSAFTGFVHALHRRICDTREFGDLELDGIGIICHQFEPQVVRPAGRLTNVFALTRNPVTKEGATAAIVEEGRAHLEVSLLIGLHGDYALDHSASSDNSGLATRLFEHVGAMRLAGGSIYPVSNMRYHQPLIVSWPAGDNEGAREASRKLRRRLLPGFALVDRTYLLAERLLEMQQTQPTATALEALLEYSSINWECATDHDDASKSVWSVRRKPGWLVPLPLGYGALSEIYAPGTVKAARDSSQPFLFVESLIGLGQWLGPHRVENLESLLWFHQAEPEVGLYRCTQVLALTR